MNNRLETIPTDVEIKQAVFGMGTYKSPGPDGMSSTFYKVYWPIIGPDMISEVQNFFTTGRLKQAYNHTFLALIPKSNNASKVEQFRPISLYNVFLKIITKILSSRIRPILEHLIHPSQAAFIPQRSINDNIIINHEVMHYMNGKKGSTGFMAIEIDLAKAYDRVEWHILCQILHKFGFCSKFIDMVSECISTSHFSILLNGSPFGFFKAGR